MLERYSFWKVWVHSVLVSSKVGQKRSVTLLLLLNNAGAFQVPQVLFDFRLHLFGFLKNLTCYCSSCHENHRFSIFTRIQLSINLQVTIFLGMMLSKFYSSPEFYKSFEVSMGNNIRMSEHKPCVNSNFHLTG